MDVLIDDKAKHLTPRETKVWLYITDPKNKRFPTYYSIMQYMGWKSKNAVSQVMHKLKKLKMI